MTKFFAFILIAVTLVLAPVRKSEATIGLAVSVPAIMVVGGLVAVGGTSAVLLPDLWDRGCGNSPYGLNCLGASFVGLLVLPLGLLLLDGETEVSFDELQSIKGATEEEVAIYNSEIDQLNAVNNEILEMVKADKKTDTKLAWEELGSALSPETLKVARLSGEALLKSLKK